MEPTLGGLLKWGGGGRGNGGLGPRGGGYLSNDGGDLRSGGNGGLMAYGGGDIASNGGGGGRGPMGPGGRRLSGGGILSGPTGDALYSSSLENHKTKNYSRQSFLEIFNKKQHLLKHFWQKKIIVCK